LTSSRIALAFTFALSLNVTASASAATLAMTDLEICNDSTQGFKVAIDGAAPIGVRADGCITERIYVGRHAVFPQAESQQRFTSAAWLLEVPAEGAVARFGSTNGNVGLVRVEIAPSSAGRPTLLTPRFLLPLGFSLCGWSTYGLSGNPACDPLASPMLELTSPADVERRNVVHRPVPRALAGELRAGLMQARLGVRPSLPAQFHRAPSTAPAASAGYGRSVGASHAFFPSAARPSFSHSPHSAPASTSTSRR
jgi:hypothetical protein